MRLFDLQDMDWCSLPLIRLLEDGNNKLLVESVGRAVTNGEEYASYSLRYTSRQGTQLDLNVRSMPLFDNEGGRHGSVLVADDIPEEQRLVNCFCRYMEQEVVDRVLKDIDWGLRSRPDRPLCIELGLVQVKGRAESVRVYGVDDEWIRESAQQ